MPQVEGARLGRGDTVSMVVTFNPRTGERGGQRVRLLRQGDKDAKKPEFVAERNPNAVRYIGNRAVRLQGLVCGSGFTPMTFRYMLAAERWAFSLQPCMEYRVS